MSDEFEGVGDAEGRRSYVTPRYSRTLGITSYRRRRRASKVLRFVVAVGLLAIIGGAAVLLGRQYFDYENLPFELPFELPSAESFGPAEERTQDEIIPTVQPAEIRIVATGDVIASSAVVDSGRKESGAYSFDHLFRPLVDELSQFDMRIVSQETNLSGSKFGFGSLRPLNAPQELGRAEVNAGFNVILRATDHTLDNGREGIHNELLWWHSEMPDVPVLGIAEPEPEENPGLSDYVNNVYVYEKDGFKVAVLNHTWNIGEGDRSVVSALVQEKIADDVRKAREAGAEMIVACPHWGRENDTNLSDEETTFVQVYVNEGVDVIFGTNPRVMQRVEVLQNAEGHKTVCFYSLGCLTSTLYAQNFLGAIGEVTLARDDTGSCSIKSAVIKPVMTHRASGEEFATYLVRDYTDELAWSSWDPGMTPEDLARRSTDILGEEYDAAAGELRVNLGTAEPEPAPAPEGEQAEGEGEPQPAPEEQPQA